MAEDDRPPGTSILLRPFGVRRWPGLRQFAGRLGMDIIFFVQRHVVQSARNIDCSSNGNLSGFFDLLSRC